MSAVIAQAHRRPRAPRGRWAPVAVLLLARLRTQVPYPILLVVGGAALGFVPGCPRRRARPRARARSSFLPPLLYAAAFFSSLRDLRANVRADRAARRRPGHRSRRSASPSSPTRSSTACRGRRRSCSARSSRRPTRSPRPRSPSRSARRGAASRSSRASRWSTTRPALDRLQVRGRRRWSPGRFSLAEARRRVRPQRGRRRRDRPGRRLGRRRAAQRARRRADRDHDLAAHAVLRLPAGRGARRLARCWPRSRAGIYLGWRSPRADHARRRGSRPSRSGRSSSSSSTPRCSCSSACSCRASLDGIAGDYSTGELLAGRGRRSSAAVIVMRFAVGLPVHLPAAPALAPRARARARPPHWQFPAASWPGRACAARSRWPRRWRSR